MNGEPPERLIAMANQIARFFVSQPRGSAAEGVAAHLRAYWDPVMRDRLRAWVRAGGGGLDPVAREAVLSLVAGDAAAAIGSGGDAG